MKGTSNFSELFLKYVMPGRLRSAKLARVNGHRIGPGKRGVYTYHKKIGDPTWKQNSPKYRNKNRTVPPPRP